MVHLVLSPPISTYKVYTVHVVCRSTVKFVMSLMQLDVIKVVHGVFNLYLHVQKMPTKSEQHDNNVLVHGDGYNEGITYPGMLRALRKLTNSFEQ